MLFDKVIEKRDKTETAIGLGIKATKPAHEVYCVFIAPIDSTLVELAVHSQRQVNLIKWPVELFLEWGIIDKNLDVFVAYTSNGINNFMQADSYLASNLSSESKGKSS